MSDVKICSRECRNQIGPDDPGRALLAITPLRGDVLTMTDGNIRVPVRRQHAASCTGTPCRRANASP